MTTRHRFQIGAGARHLNRRAFMGVTITAAGSVALPTMFTLNGSLEAANDNQPPPPPPTAPAGASWAREYPHLEYRNQDATRNRRCTEALERHLLVAGRCVYGAEVVIEIYSGGQAAKGTPGKRTGSIRHDDHGQGGRAADIRIRHPDGTLIAGPELARMGQYWLAARLGGVGFEMNQNGAGGGGLHLDEWVAPPPGGGMLWYYTNSQDEARASGAMAMLQSGLRGVYPPLIPPIPESLSSQTIRS